MVNKRQVNKSFDEDPSIHHQFNFEISKPYIKNKKVLDIGCWTGQFEKIAITTTNKISGIDPDKYAIKFSKQKFPNLEFKVGDALNLPYKNKTFNTVTFLEVIEHVPLNTENKAISEIKRVLKPKGYLILSTPKNHPISILLDPAYFLLKHRHYSLSYLIDLLSIYDFKIKKIYITGGFWRLLSLNLQTISKIIFKKPFTFPKWLNKKINDEYYKGGFAQIHLIAQLQNSKKSSKMKS